ncbi:MAG: hypothetical protein HUU15_10595 [Candidatus Brocadiae bacterium]|nr:hypothetical protein [Candidatus Brocadiia bacterium]
MSREHHFRWEWDLQSPPEAIWPFIADTNRFNADAGIPAVRRVEGGSGADGERLQMSVAGMTMEWDEAPFEWEAPRRFGVVRNYRSGPIERIRVAVNLDPRDGGGSRLTYQIWMIPRGFLAGMVLPLQMKWKSRPAFETVFRAYDQAAVSHRPPALPPPAVSFTRGGEERLEAAVKTLVDFGRDEALVGSLATLIRTADDVTLMRLRPYALADRLGAPRKRVLDLCLYSVRAGLLDFRWDMLCPSCRGAKAVGDSLAGIRSSVHCDSCQIDFEVNFEQNVELTFRPNPSIRKVDQQEFCVGGPQVTPHIVAQQVLKPGERRDLVLGLEPGAYRVRSRTERGGQTLRVTTDGPSELAVRARPGGWPEGELTAGPRVQTVFENLTDGPRILLVERVTWGDDAVTAAHVTGLQVFRDLFAREALRPGEQISVGSLTVLFTDLLESTRLYREIGDARAFGLVMEHFDVLKAAIAEHDGALVKTIGDAVLAVFRRPVSALEAYLSASETLARPGKAGRRPLLLKAGIHVGPCIAVTLNDRLDYFGSTVNVAARLVNLCSGGDLVISTEFKEDPEVARYLAGTSHRQEPIHAALKGFDAVRFELVRLIPVWSEARSDLPKEPKTHRF